MRRRLAVFGLAAAVFLADRATKELIQSRVAATEVLPVIPGFFNIVHTRNAGAAFGLLAGAPGEWRALFLTGLSVAVLIIVARLLWQNSAGGRLLLASLALILGGALGNLYDRVVDGSVTDFLQVFLGPYEWPSFNVADSAISVGAALLVWDLWRGRR